MGRLGASCLHDALAAGTAQLGPHIAHDLEAFLHPLQYFRDVLTQRAQPPATCANLFLRRIGLHFPRQVFRQRLTCRFDQTESLGGELSI